MSSVQRMSLHNSHLSRVKDHSAVMRWLQWKGVDLGGGERLPPVRLLHGVEGGDQGHQVPQLPVDGQGQVGREGRAAQGALRAPPPRLHAGHALHAPIVPCIAGAVQFVEVVPHLASSSEGRRRLVFSQQISSGG